MTELAWDLYRDPRAARLLSMGRRTAWNSHIFDPHFLTLAFGRALPARARFAARSSVCPQAGIAALKSVEGGAYWGSRAIEAVIKFGPYGNGHGHADKLALEIAGAGRKTCIEELEREATDWRYWNSTVSHNSVVVGGRSQPGNEEMFALNDSCGRLVYRRFAKGLKVACAEAPEVYEGLTCYRRTVAVTDAYVIDVFEVASKRPTVFDWFLHGKGTIAIEGVVLGVAEFGCSSQGYESLEDVHGGAPAGQVRARFSEGHTVFLPDAHGAFVFASMGPWKVDTRRPALVVRREGPSAVFVAVHDPSGQAVRSVSAEAGAKAVALVVTGRGFTDTVTLPLGIGRPARARSPKPEIGYSRKRRGKR